MLYYPERPRWRLIVAFLKHLLSYKSLSGMKILRNLSFGLLGLLVCVLMAATCVEKVWGTPFVVRHVYGSPASSGAEA